MLYSKRRKIGGGRRKRSNQKKRHIMGGGSILNGYGKPESLPLLVILFKIIKYLKELIATSKDIKDSERAEIFLASKEQEFSELKEKIATLKSKTSHSQLSPDEKNQIKELEYVELIENFDTLNKNLDIFIKYADIFIEHVEEKRDTKSKQIVSSLSLYNTMNLLERNIGELKIKLDRFKLELHSTLSEQIEQSEFSELESKLENFKLRLDSYKLKLKLYFNPYSVMQPL